ncbi:MAG: ATP-binding protein [Bacteroidota bacterium]
MKSEIIVGREKEIKNLEDALRSDESELISVVGRRRVGKTFLVQSVYANKIDFEITGIQNATKREQLENFTIALNLYAKPDLPIGEPTSWLKAFQLLILYLEKKKKSRNSKRVVFFDELPWLSTHRSGFLKAFGFFWNSWAVKNNTVVVICGSAASWMIKKVVQNKGGLYNRITKRIRLQPFTLREAALFLKKRGHQLDHYQVVELYMIIGGIPHYLKQIERGQSIAQNIDRMCFDLANGVLYNEFEQLYPSLFEHSEKHIAIVRALSSSKKGLSRKQIIKSTNITNGGGLTNTLDELVYSNFISEYFPFGKRKKDKLYRLTDEYSLFYLKFIERYKKEGAGVWERFQQTPTYRSWSGYAFENICLKHISEIKIALGIQGIFSTHASFYHSGTQDMSGCQIDLLIDRSDKTINLCEIKFSNNEFIISKSYAKALREKVALFKYYSETKKQIFLTFISTFGLFNNEYSRSVVGKELVLQDLF